MFCQNIITRYDCVACREDRFEKCPNTGRCILASYVCDDYNDCGDWSDELNCSEFFFCLSNCRLIVALSNGTLKPAVAYGFSELGGAQWDPA